MAWYHWQQQWAPSDSLFHWAQGEEPPLWYVRFFDVDLSEDGRQPVPVSTLSWRKPLPDSVAAVVFLTTRALRATPADSIEALAAKMWRLLDAMARKAEVHLFELQLDCDWTPRLQHKYFRLLAAFRQMLPAGCALSATLRLHQIRWAERTGVPPVDRGMLMVYNTGEVGQPGTRNSILTTEALRPYLSGFADYPLPLDIVWPVFRWGVVFRQGRFVRLISPLSARELADTLRFRPAGAAHFAVRRSTYLRGHYLYAGDTIRLEAVPCDTLLHAAQLLAAAMGAPPGRVAFYHLDATVPQYWTHEQLQRILEAAIP